MTISPLILIRNNTLQFLGAATILISGLYLNAKYLDKRPFSEYGLKFRKITFHYFIIGALIGAVAICLILVIGNLTETLSISKYQANIDSKPIFLFGSKMILVAIIEESLFRGYFFTTLYAAFRSNKNFKKLALVSAVGCSSILFGVAHFSNDHASILSIGFLTVNGIIWCVPFIMTKNLGLSIGMHTSWNFTQTFLGFTMSGNKANYSMFNIENIGHPIWTGGNYGPEAGLLGFMGFMTMLLLTLAYLRRWR